MGVLSLLGIHDLPPEALIMFDDVCLVVRDLGFPIFVAVYLLLYFSKIIKGLTSTIAELTLWLKSKNGGK
jgi:hypothetical protein